MKWRWLEKLDPHLAGTVQIAVETHQDLHPGDSKTVAIAALIKSGFTRRKAARKYRSTSKGLAAQARHEARRARGLVKPRRRSRPKRRRVAA